MSFILINGVPHFYNFIVSFRTLAFSPAFLLFVKKNCLYSDRRYVRVLLDLVGHDGVTGLGFLQSRLHEDLLVGDLTLLYLLDILNLSVAHVSRHKVLLGWQQPRKTSSRDAIGTRFASCYGCGTSAYTRVLSRVISYFDS